MPMYVYEPVPECGTVPTGVRYEFRQGMNEAPLTAHPESGEPIRRVISGGMGYMQPSGSGSPGPAAGGCGAGCACAT
jgi:predicted nucleic acid-binding Zn ribbon protein